MHQKKFFQMVLLSAPVLILAGCSAFGSKAPPTPDPLAIQATIDAAATQAMQTIAAQLTSTAQAQPTNTPTPTVVPTQASSPTPLATSTPLPTATKTRVPATLAPTNTPTPANYVCTLVSTSPAAGTKYNVNDEFDAVWVVKNSGIKNWEIGTLDLKYDSGQKMQKVADIFDVNTLVEAGKDLTLIVDMVVPAASGKYTATWKLLMDGTTLCTLPVSIEAVTP